jgi:ketosteroid isomerase-like protein
MQTHPHAERARATLAAVSAGRLEELERQMTDDIVWHVGGNHPLSGDYNGRQAVTEYLRKVAALTRGSLRLTPEDILASDRHLGIFLSARADAAGATLDTTMVEAIRLADDGRWAEYWALADDQPQVDAFWKAVAQ